MAYLLLPGEAGGHGAAAMSVSAVMPLYSTYESSLTWHGHQEQHGQHEEKVEDPHGRQASRLTGTGWTGQLLPFIKVPGARPQVEASDGGNSCNSPVMMA